LSFLSCLENERSRGEPARTLFELPAGYAVKAVVKKKQ